MDGTESLFENHSSPSITSKPNTKINTTTIQITLFLEDLIPEFDMFLDLTRPPNLLDLFLPCEGSGPGYPSLPTAET